MPFSAGVRIFERLIVLDRRAQRGLRVPSISLPPGHLTLAPSKMRTFMIDILLQGMDNETRVRLLPAEQAIIKEWEAQGTLLASYIKQDVAGIYLVLKAEDALDADAKLSILPYYPYMKIAIVALR